MLGSGHKVYTKLFGKEKIEAIYILNLSIRRNLKGLTNEGGGSPSVHILTLR